MAPTRAPPTSLPPPPSCRACAGSIRSATDRRDGVAPFPDRGNGASRLPPADDEPGQDRLSRLHLGHDRHAEGRHAFRQHAARQRAARWSRTGITTSARCCLSLSPLSHHIATVALAQIAGGRHGAGGQRAAARHDAARLDPRDRRDLRDGRADACDGHPRRDARRRGSNSSARSGSSTWPARRSRARSRRRFSTAASCRRTSMA